MPVYGTVRYYHIVLSIKEEGRLGIYNRCPRHLEQTRGPRIQLKILSDLKSERMGLVAEFNGSDIGKNFHSK